MITREQFYVAYCDGCDMGYEDDDRFLCVHDKSTMKEVLIGNDWIFKGKKCYCPECIEKGIDKQKNK